MVQLKEKKICFVLNSIKSFSHTQTCTLNCEFVLKVRELVVVVCVRSNTITIHNCVHKINQIRSE